VNTITGMPTVDGAKLRRLRTERFLSIRSLAEAAGISPTTMLRMEQNRGPVRPVTVRKLAEALGVEPTEIAER
jgi:transcriptional regulator with XRE-family HTH domain